jgi:DNA modification methylase
LKPYYEHGGITIYHGDAVETLLQLPIFCAQVMLTDPPYGISYKSGAARVEMSNSISGDEDTRLRDFALQWWLGRPAIVFGSWKAQRPKETRARLIWDTKGALGMGDLSLPWKPSDQEIYVLGKGFSGHRGSNVLRYPPVQSMAENGRVHPHQKPVELLTALLIKCPEGAVIDPFMGSGSTLLSAKNLGRSAIGIELEERYCEIAAKRLSQEVLTFDEVPA